MKILAIVLALVVVAAASAGLYLKYRLDNTPDDKDLEAALDSEIKKLTKNDLSYGLVVGVYKDGKSFIKGYGTVNKEGTTVPSALTVFQIASVSKLFTASLLQILCDEGVLRMDATLGELIGGSIVLSPAAQQVTLKQLATHTSGFPSIPKPLGLKATELAGKENLMQNPYSHLGPKYLFDYLKTTEDKREPGRFEYSNFGMGLLGHVLEIITKKNLESLISEKLLAPLDMRNTALVLTPEMKMHLAQGYTANGESSPMWTFSALAGAGAFNSNAENMMRFIRANIEDGSNMSRTLKKMHGPQFGGDTGIGWLQPMFLDRFFNNKTVVWHNGMVGGYASYVSIDTWTKTGIVILSNKAVDVTMLGMMLTRQARTQSWSSQHAF
jgi:CubicO group peptidase (beta-lactamase class C family)